MTVTERPCGRRLKRQKFVKPKFWDSVGIFSDSNDITLNFDFLNSAHN